MNEKIKTVFEKVSKNEELKAELKANPPKTAEELVTLVAKKGAELTVDEIKSANKELSNENLEKISEDCNQSKACRMGYFKLCESHRRIKRAHFYGFYSEAS